MDKLLKVSDPNPKLFLTSRAVATCHARVRIGNGVAINLSTWDTWFQEKWLKPIAFAWNAANYIGIGCKLAFEKEGLKLIRCVHDHNLLFISRLMDCDRMGPFTWGSAQRLTIRTSPQFTVNTDKQLLPSLSSSHRAWASAAVTHRVSW